ncbi:hypothetical protein HYQ45_004112 [Verticillium longisporum]|uniref:Secreted protein n=1 Tax=Verticillium longisporum TaxID=100787 RepID=A0A8I2ZTQ7_VERLO|nr:hypothetical protein HYQ45_004112 [Verticillium longisporum]
MSNTAAKSLLTLQMLLIRVIYLFRLDATQRATRLLALAVSNAHIIVEAREDLTTAERGGTRACQRADYGNSVYSGDGTILESRREGLGTSLRCQVRELDIVSDGGVC